jgi:hypothetical protein
MSDDPIAVLERELVDAARRRASVRPGGRRRLNIGALAAAALVAVTLAVAGGALILLAGHQRPSATTATDRSRQQLIDILAVLRRPQTKADLNPRILSQSASIPMQGSPDVPLVRFATTTPWGEKLYLVPTKPPTVKQLNILGLPPRLIERLRARGETLSVFSPQGGGGTSDAAAIEAGDAIGTEGAGHSFAGGSSQTRFILVVPNGVAKVEFMLPRQSSPGANDPRIYPHSLGVTARVHDNIAAVQVNRETDGPSAPMVWYSADGRVLKRIGDFAKLNRVIAPPRPGPQTALSRAAERDPSTPNRVWITPNVGGPHTKFMLHFRVLLNDADYRYRLTGTRCPAITLNGGDGGGSGDLRGRIWRDIVDGVDGQSWCPGTYNLSATVMDLGRRGKLKHPAAPFGTGTFTVRP